MSPVLPWYIRKPGNEVEKYHGTRKIHEVKNNKDGGCAKELDVVDESDEEIKRIFRYLKRLTLRSGYSAKYFLQW